VSQPPPADTASEAGHLYVDWAQYHALIEQLAWQIHGSGWQPDHVLCLARGGLRPGDILSRMFDRPLAILAVSSYREDRGTTRGTLDIAPGITARFPLAGKVLLVDDLVDSGETMQQICVHLLETFPEVTEMRTAVLWSKGCSHFTPDYHVVHLPDNPWIHQPFEIYDGGCLL